MERAQVPSKIRKWAQFIDTIHDEPGEDREQWLGGNYVWITTTTTWVQLVAPWRFAANEATLEYGDNLDMLREAFEHGLYYDADHPDYNITGNEDFVGGSSGETRTMPNGRIEIIHHEAEVVE